MEVYCAGTLAEGSAGWQSRLHGLGKGYKVSTGLGKFGRISVQVKRNESSVTLSQANAQEIKTIIEVPTVQQRSIINDLKTVGLVTKINELH